MQNWIQSPDGAINLLSVTHIETAPTGVTFHFVDGNSLSFMADQYPVFCEAMQQYVQRFPNLERSLLAAKAMERK